MRLSERGEDWWQTYCSVLGVLIVCCSSVLNLLELFALVTMQEVRWLHTWVMLPLCVLGTAGGAVYYRKLKEQWVLDEAERKLMGDP